MDSREQAIEAVGALEADLEALHQAQKHFQRAYRSLKRKLERGVPASRALASMDLPGLRDELAQEMVRIDEARQRLRTSLIKLCLEEGLPIGEVARLWGFSRQLAQRYAKNGTTVATTSVPDDVSSLL
jgi:hypothetical protein